MDSRKTQKDQPVDHPFVIGKAYLFRTVTMHLIGMVSGQSGKFLVLKEAVWVSESGRFMNFLAGDLAGSELEPVGVAYLNIDSLVDAFPWANSIPSKQQ